MTLNNHDRRQHIKEFPGSWHVSEAISSFLFYHASCTTENRQKKNGLDIGEMWPKMAFLFLLVLLHVPASAGSTAAQTEIREMEISNVLEFWPDCLYIL